MKIRRRRHRRRNSRKQFVIISVSLIVFVFILGTAYSAFSTNLSINASGEVIQPEYVSIGGNDVEVVSSGDGLYADSYESGRYIYRGGDPDNYILLGDELYRIIAKEEDGTYKVRKSESVGSMVFDPGYETELSDNILTTTASSTTGTRYSSNADDFCYSESEDTYYGCNAWGSNETTLDSNGNNVTAALRAINGKTYYNLPDTEAYLNTYLNQTYYDSLDESVQAIIVKHLFNIGTVNFDSSDLSADISAEAMYKWEGKIGLVSATDYVKATTNSACISINSYRNDSNCYSTKKADNWMTLLDQRLGYMRFLTPYEGSGSRGVLGVFIEGAFSPGYAMDLYDVLPTFYLSSSIILQGEGTESSPYEIIS